MEENLPEIQPDSSAARRPQGQRDLVVTSGGEIYLPASPRVGIAAAMEANTVIALLLGKDL